MKKFGLLGHNISYSLSPKIHAIIYDCIGLNAQYTLLSVESVKESIDEIKKFDAFNITKPYKNDIVEFLRCNFSPIGAVNTVINRNGSLIGYNTDIEGFSRDITDFVGGFRGATLVLGAGGAAEAISYALGNLGFDVYIYNRTYIKAQTLADTYGAIALSDSDLSSFKPRLAINCTTVGLNGEQALDGKINLTELRYAYDTIYAPPVTPFLVTCGNTGAKTRNGIGMLIYQALRAVEKFVDAPIDKKTETEILKRITKELNI